MSVKNSKSLPEVYFGLHMVEGVAEYAEEGVRILVGEDAIKNMNPTFQGKPVYVEHIEEELDPENIEKEKELAGVVIRSFFNKPDGKNWTEFTVITDEAKQAIRSGWKLSNAYVPTAFAGGGLWHGVEYQKEVTGGEYEHLAIVPNPRYEESVILTPEQFKEYNLEKERELLRLANSKDKPKEKKAMGLNIFKRQKVENAASIDGLMVELPKSKKEILLTDVVTQYDAIVNMNGYANGDHMVKVGEDEMSVNDLVKKHIDMQNEMTEMKKPKEDAVDNDGEGDAEVKDCENAEDKEDTDEEGDRGGDKHMNEDDEDVEAPKKEEKKQNTVSKSEAEKAAIRAKADRLANAHLRADKEETARVEVSVDQIARGKSRYGS